MDNLCLGRHVTMASLSEHTIVPHQEQENYGYRGKISFFEYPQWGNVIGSHYTNVEPGSGL
jgi:hypothetical protein